MVPVAGEVNPILFPPQNTMAQHRTHYASPDTYTDNLVFLSRLQRDNDSPLSGHASPEWRITQPSLAHNPYMLISMLTLPRVV
jgi:hypothetical protein